MSYLLLCDSLTQNSVARVSIYYFIVLYQESEVGLIGSSSSESFALRRPPSWQGSAGEDLLPGSSIWFLAGSSSL